MTRWRTASLRLAFGILVAVAVGWQLSIHMRLGLSLINFFSYFTNLANLFAAVVLVLVAVRAFTGREPTPADTILRAISVVNMAIVGVVFAALLRNVDLGALLPWVNFVLHYLMPCVVILDWLLQPPRIRLGSKHVVLCMLSPAIYLVYVLLRGGMTGWYPYPFLNPANVGGYGGVATYAAGIALTFVGAAWLLFAAGNKLRR